MKDSAIRWIKICVYPTITTSLPNDYFAIAAAD